MKSVLFVTTQGVANVEENFDQVIGSNLLISLAIIAMVAIIHFVGKSKTMRTSKD